MRRARHLLTCIQTGCILVHMSKAEIREDFTSIDTFAEVATVTIKAANLKAGMVLVDEFNCPVAGVDHRVSTNRGSGDIAFLIADLENGGWNRMAFRPTIDMKVMAA